MKKFLTLVVISFCSASLIGCANMSNQDAGMLTGGVAGGLLGSTIGGGNGKLVAIAAGTLAGAFIGSAVGKNMDENDKMRMNHALEDNAAGVPAYWRNERTGTNYEVIPTKNVTVDGNQYCREYRTIAYIAGKKQQVYGTACRQPDGTWQMVN